MASGMLHPGFQGDLIALVRKHGLGNLANTPDHEVAGILTERYEQLRLAAEQGHEPGPQCDDKCQPGHDHTPLPEPADYFRARGG
jgi:hypothetical protein